MATYSKHLLSGSTNGKHIDVATSSSPGTLIHTAVSGTSSLDEIWIYATNSLSSSLQLTIEWGAAATGMDMDSAIQITIPSDGGYTLVVPGLFLQNSLEVRAYSAGGTGAIMINGYVNRITS